jgi:hypothetical protein
MLFLQRILLALLVATTLPAAAQPLDQVLRPFTAHYKGRANGLAVSDLGMRELKPLGDGRYQLQYSASAMIYTLEETSVFKIEDGMIVPQTYRSNRGSFFNRRKASLDFDWSKGQGRYEFKGKRGEFVLEPNTQDPLTGGLELARLLRADQAKYLYREAEKRGISSNELVLIDQPEIETAIGTLKSWHLERLHKDPKRKTEIWLHHEYPAIALRVHQLDDGDEFQLDITKLEQK